MPKAAVLLINPPNPPGYVSNKDSMGGFGQLYGVGAPPFPPLDLPYLAGAVTAAGFETVVIEAGALRLDLEAFCAQVREAAGSDRPMVVLRTSLPTIDWDLEVCAALRAGTGVGPIYLYGAAVKPLLARITATRPRPPSRRASANDSSPSACSACSPTKCGIRRSPCSRLQCVTGNPAPSSGPPTVCAPEVVSSWLTRAAASWVSVGLVMSPPVSADTGMPT